MLNKKTAYYVGYIVFGIAITLWVLLNPYMFDLSLSKAGYAAEKTNIFFGGMNLKYRISPKDIISALRFLQYFLLGVCVTEAVKLKFSNIFKNITLPLFYGLFLAVIECFFRSFSKSVDLVFASFIPFCAGLFFCILLGCVRFGKNASKYNSKYKYKGRR